QGSDRVEDGQSFAFERDQLVDQVAALGPGQEQVVLIPVGVVKLNGDAFDQWADEARQCGDFGVVLSVGCDVRIEVRVARSAQVLDDPIENLGAAQAVVRL